jgi:hypothetical protein
MLKNRIGSMAMIGSLLLLVSCTTPKLPTAQTASQQFAALGSNREKGIAKNFYSLGQGDAVKRWYWDNIEGHAERPVSSEAQAQQPDSGLQHKYVVLPVPEHVENGTVKAASQEVVEVVQFIARVPSPAGFGHLNIVK